MITSHTLSVTAHPYSEGSPRYYYAENYPIGSVVDNKGESWRVGVVNNTVMFILEQEFVLARLLKENRLKACVKRRNDENGKIAGWWPCLKDTKTNEIVWQCHYWMVWRDHGNNAAKPEAVAKIQQIRKDFL